MLRIRWEDYTDNAIRKYAEGDSAMAKIEAQAAAFDERIEIILQMIGKNEEGHMAYRKENESQHNDIEMRLMG